jgi:hypothetical protein
MIPFEAVAKFYFKRIRICFDLALFIVYPFSARLQGVAVTNEAPSMGKI